MVGVGVGFQQPLHLQVMGSDKGDDFVSLGGRGTPGRTVVVEHRVDNRTLPAIGLVDHVAVGRGGGVEESFNQCGHGHEPVQGWKSQLQHFM
ncbi:hypothetical protein D3C72_2028630 [compost metagenome]